MNKISIIIPTWERVDMTLRSFSKVYDDERIYKIIIVDDCSSDGVYNELVNRTKDLNKINLYRNDVNLDANKNKMKSVSLSPTDYCILLDSDNEIDIEYIDKIYEQTWAEDTILQPTFAKPLFDFRILNGLIVNKQNIMEHIDKHHFDTSLNGGNYFFNKEKYLSVWDDSINPYAYDVIYQNYNWLKAGYNIQYVEGLEYTHNVHDGSYYIKVSHLNPEFLDELVKKLRNML